jgi:hypothetical protein
MRVSKGLLNGPESVFFEHLQNVGIPVTLSRQKPGTGVTTSNEAVNFGASDLFRASNFVLRPALA